MKKVIIFSCVAVSMAFTCAAQQKSSKSNNGYAFCDEPTYKLDRRLAAAQTAVTDNGGASGAGTGSSYGSVYYRGVAYKNAARQSKQKSNSVSPLALKEE